MGAGLESVALMRRTEPLWDVEEWLRAVRDEAGYYKVVSDLRAANKCKLAAPSPDHTDTMSFEPIEDTEMPAYI